MNKKLIPLFSILLSFLPSCKKESSDRPLIMKSELLSGPIRLETAKQIEDIFNFEDMVLMISQEGCSVCNHIYPYLTEIVKENNMIMYQAHYNVYSQLKDEKYMVDKLTGTPTFIFVKDKKIIDIEIPPSNSKKALSNFINSRINLINYYNLNTYKNVNDSSLIVNDNGKTETVNYTYHLLNIDEDTDALALNYEALENKINSTSSITIYYTWRRCRYCRELRNVYLDNYLNSNSDKRIYYYETDGYMQKRRDNDETIKIEGLKQWKAFNTKFKFDYYPIYLDLIKDYISGTPCLINYPTGKNAFYSSASGEKINDDKTLSFERSYYKEIDELKTTKTDYAEAKEELNSTLYDKSLQIELSKVDEFLKEYN